jgi:hypothetical protein
MQIPPHISHPIPGGLLAKTTRTAAYLYIHQYIWITFKKRYLRSSRPKHFGSSSIRQKSNNTRKEASEQHDHAQNEALAFVGNHVQARYCSYQKYGAQQDRYDKTNSLDLPFRKVVEFIPLLQPASSRISTLKAVRLDCHGLKSVSSRTTYLEALPKDCPQ